jgi:GST-like protein
VAATYTLFGAKGSGSAIAEAALGMTGTAFRSVDAASWEPGAARHWPPAA